MTTSITVLLVFVNNCFNLALLEVCFTEVIIAANVFQFKFVKWCVTHVSLLGTCRPIVSDVFVIMTLVLKSRWLSYILQKAGVLLGYFLGKKTSLEKISSISQVRHVQYVTVSQIILQSSVSGFACFSYFAKSFLLFFFSSSIEITSVCVCWCVRWFCCFSLVTLQLG